MLWSNALLVGGLGYGHPEFFIIAEAKPIMKLACLLPCFIYDDDDQFFSICQHIISMIDNSHMTLSIFFTTRMIIIVLRHGHVECAVNVRRKLRGGKEETMKMGLIEYPSTTNRLINSYRMTSASDYYRATHIALKIVERNDSL